MSILVKALIFLVLFFAILGYSCIVAGARYDRETEKSKEQKPKEGE